MNFGNQKLLGACYGYAHILLCWSGNLGYAYCMSGRGLEGRDFLGFGGSVWHFMHGRCIECT
jgi:hypothetical protein